MTTESFIADRPYNLIVEAAVALAHFHNNRSGFDAADARGFLAELGVFPISAREVCEALTPAPAALGKSLTPTPKHTLSNALYRLI